MWRALYPNFTSFEQHHALTQQRLLDAQERGGQSSNRWCVVPIDPPPGSLPADVKTAVIRVTGGACVAGRPADSKSTTSPRVLRGLARHGESPDALRAL
jgi:hypothetical protein